MLGLLAALDEVERIAGDRRPIEQFVEDRHEPRMQIAGADLVALEQQIVELHRLLQCRRRRVREPRALLAGLSVEQVDHDAVCEILGALGRIAQALDQRVDRIDDVRPEELRQDEIPVALPLIFLLGRERARGSAGSARALQGGGVLHRGYSRQLQRFNLREHAKSGNLSR